MTPLSRKILIVDDSPEDRETWRHYLSADENCRYVFVERNNLESALEACRSEQPDCILLDYQLPDGNGVDFIGEIQSLGGTLKFPTVMLTATGSELVAVRAMKAGAQDYLIKHRLDPDTLHRVLNAAVYKAHTDRLLARQRDELEEAYRLAKEASARKDQFLAMLSHELRTPLTPILTVVSDPEVATKSSPEELQEIFGLIRRNIELEARLIDDLLDLTRITHGKLELRTQPTDVHELIRHALDTCRPAAQAKRLELTESLRAERHVVRGDPARIQQVVWNLLSNAVKFTPADGAVRIETHSLPGGWFEVAVTDSGVGIPPARLGGIFNAFEQGDSLVSQKFGGLGLGLAICKALVEAHGGRIRAESAGPGQGATFRVQLETAAENSDATPLVQPAAAKRETAGPARSILLVEDHEDSARALRTLLRRRGYEVMHAGTVEEAKRTFESRAFDAVITDLGLPDGNGAELIRGLRALRPVPCIVLSGFGEAEILSKSLDAGAQEHLLKPVAWPQLEETLRRLLPS